MADERKPTIISEAEIPETWEPIDMEPIVPGQSAAPAMPGTLPPYFRGSLSANLEHDAQLVALDKNPRVASIPLMPLAPSANPQTNAAVSSIISETKTTTTNISSGMRFRGVWNSFTSYAINDVVLFNLSAYVAATGSLNLQPDLNNPINWTLLSENLVFNATLVSSFGPGFGTFDQNVIKTGTNSNVIVGPLVASAGEIAFLAVTRQQGNLSSGWVALDPGDGAWIISVKPFTNMTTISENLGNPSQNWCSNLSTFQGSWTSGSLTGTVTSVTINGSNVLTAQCANSFIAGTTVKFTNFTNPSNSFLNNTSMVITSATPTSFTGTYTHGATGPNSDSGTATDLPYLQKVASGVGVTSPVVLSFPNPVVLGSTIMVVAISSDTNAQSNITGVSDTRNGSGYTIKATSVGCGTSVAFFQNAASGSTTVTVTGSFGNVATEIFIFELPGAASLKTYIPYDVFNFRGSYFVCLKETTSDAFADPTSWGQIAQGTGYVLSLPGSYAPVATDAGRLLSFTSSGASTLTLPNPVPSPPAGITETGWYILVENIGTGTLTVARNGLTIDGVAANLTLGQNQGVWIFADNTGNYETWHGVNSLVVPGIFTVTAPNTSGQITIGLANENANTFFRGPNSGPPGQPFFGPITSADLPPTSPLAVATAIGTLQTHTVSGTLRINGTIPPAGVYRVSANFFLQFNPSAGSLAFSFTYQDITASRSVSPASIDTSALNVGATDIVVVSDGIHDITWTMTLV